MAVKPLVFKCAGVLIVGGILALWASFTTAAEPMLAPAPSAEPLSAEASQATAPQSLQPQPASQLSADDDECCPELCGAACASPPGSVWLRADYLMWFTSGVRLPPLVTTSVGTPPVNEAGVLGLSTTRILYGDSTALNDGRSGVRTTIGTWIDRCHRWGVEIDYFTLGERSNGFSADSTTTPILTRPFFNVQTGVQASELVGYPGVSSGPVTVDVKDYFQSAGAILTYNLGCCSGCETCDPCEDECVSCVPMTFGRRTDLIAGFRYYTLSDALTVHETPTLLQSVAPHSEIATFDIHDNFRAKNDFYGTELGLRTQLYRGRWSLDILTKLAIGNTHSAVNINGTTDMTANGKTSNFTEGILAGSTNSGVFERDEFTVIPELTLELGYQVNCHWRAYVGYDLLYWGNISRAAEQVDLNLDPRNFPPSDTAGLPFPAFAGRTSAFWAQGVNIGTEFRF
ncbi:MAG: BBP7 family outer membrane beta-barrel protein [Thermoguttaceae bacterium]